MEKSLDATEPVQIQKSKFFQDTKSTGSEDAVYDMVVFCHLRWDFVYQRPQHIISRLSEKYSVLLVEEPIPVDPELGRGYELDVVSDNLHILKPRVDSIAEITPILKRFLKNDSADVGWFYSAAFSVLLADFKFETIVYDCMDELSLFKGAPKELIDQEKYLLSQADLVFTGGKALFEAKNSRHSNVHCFPSSVDRAHFELVHTDIPVPEDIDFIPAPIVGYYGVIDERIDLELLRETAVILPYISFVMIGPLAKIGPEDLPCEKNIYYLGMKPYESLPNYLKKFDIAMMPFALNDATKYISPTKTLEYMAAKIPIISTAITDVVRDYSNCTHIIDDAGDFVTAIKSILLDRSDGHISQYDEILAQTSWSATVKKMDQLITSISK